MIPKNVLNLSENVIPVGQSFVCPMDARRPLQKIFDVCSFEKLNVVCLQEQIIKASIAKHSRANQTANETHHLIFF